jgi:hypothetical protein
VLPVAEICLFLKTSKSGAVLVELVRAPRNATCVNVIKQLDFAKSLCALLGEGPIALTYYHSP